MTSRAAPRPPVAYRGGRALTRVDRDPRRGEYALDPATGVLTFAAADVGRALAFDAAFLRSVAVPAPGPPRVG